MANVNLFDVIIIGGSYAGLSGAMALGRSLKNVLVIDAGRPCNKQTPHSHNFLTRDGEAPEEIFAIARQQVKQYSTVTFYDGIASDAEKTDQGFEVSTQTGKTFTAKKLIFATGIKDELPDISGFSECWGISVIHCPYCHGYEFRGKPTGIFANGEKAFHLASLVNNLTDKLYLLTNGTPDFTSDQIKTLKKHNIQVFDSKLSELEHQSGQLNAILFDDGTTLKLEALYAAVPFSQHSDLPVKLGCQLTDHGHLKVDQLQKTSIPGIYACGDNSSPFRSVSNAVLTGNVAGAIVNMDLTNEYFLKQSHHHPKLSN